MNRAVPELSIIAPCFNEEKALPMLAARVAAARAALGGAIELVLVDDGSRDDTWLVIQRLRETHDFITPARHVGNRGIVAAWRTGLAASRGRYVATIDADLQYRPEDLPRLRASLDGAGADLAQGARVQEVGRSRVRRLMTAGLSHLLNVLFGMQLHDNKSGFLLGRREVFADIFATRFAYRGFQHFVAVAAHAKGYRIVQTPIVFDPRVAGESFISRPWRFALRVVADLPWAIWEYRVAPRRRIA
jgi:phenylacetate-CoA ligase